MPSRKSALAALTLGLLAACTPYTVKVDYDAHAGYAAYKTFDWYAASARAKGRSAGVENPIMDRRVRAAIERELAAKGFKNEKAGEPDFLVTYYPIYRNRAAVITTTVGYGQPWGWRPYGYGVATRFHDVQHYQEGSIVLEIVDAKSNQLVWQGAAAGALTGLDDPREAEEQVGKAIKDLLDRFPPK
jgi:hypothetical protein